MRQTVKIPRIDSTMDEIYAKQDQYETSPFTHLMKKISHRNTYYYSNCEGLSNLWVNMNFEYTYLDKQTKINALA